MTEERAQYRANVERREPPRRSNNSLTDILSLIEEIKATHFDSDDAPIITITYNSVLHSLEVRFELVVRGMWEGRAISFSISHLDSSIETQALRLSRMVESLKA